MTRVFYSYRECSSEAPRGWPFWQRGAEDGKPFGSKTGREGPHCPSPTGHLTPPGLGEDEGTVALPSQLHRGASTGCMNTVVPWLVVLNEPLPRSPREQHALPPTSPQLPVLVSVFLCMERNKADCPSRPVCLCCWAQGAPDKLGGALGSLAIQRFCREHGAFPRTSRLSSPRRSSPVSDDGLPLVVASEQRPQELKRRSGGCAGRFANLDESMAI